MMLFDWCRGRSWTEIEERIPSGAHIVQRRRFILAIERHCVAAQVTRILQMIMEHVDVVSLRSGSFTFFVATITPVKRIGQLSTAMDVMRRLRRDARFFLERRFADRYIFEFNTYDAGAFLKRETINICVTVRIVNCEEDGPLFPVMCAAPRTRFDDGGPRTINMLYVTAVPKTPLLVGNRAIYRYRGQQITADSNARPSHSLVGKDGSVVVSTWSSDEDEDVD